MPYAIMLDAGHGGRDPGAVYNGRQEKDDNLDLVLAIGEMLQNSGIDVLYTRTTDIYQTPYEKASIANNAGVDFFISIHRNSFPTDNKVAGVESLVYDLSGRKLTMAENINQALESIGFQNRGVVARPNLVVLRRTHMPAVLVEVGFINSEADNALFDQNFTAIARAISNGILETIQAAQVSQTAPPIATPLKYRVQVGAFRNPAYAKRLLEELLRKNFPAVIQKENGFYRVLVGAYPTLEEAGRVEQALKQAGYQTLLIG